MDERYFSEKVVEWYAINKRNLPWRTTRDPYKIWLSEIILQQTRVVQGLPYYLKFIRTFPTVKTLAKASEQEVLRLWQGLGYYTRARNLHKCAQQIIETHNGVFPSTSNALQKLPGIGEYTAAAVASFAFKEPVGVLDGNVYRVLSRVFGIDKPINSNEGKKAFSVLANTLIHRNHPDLYNQGIMEFGAMHCTPKNPKCSDCVFHQNCFAAKHNLHHILPVKTKAKAARKRYFYYIVIQKGKSLLMKKRVQKDIWNGLYDFYLVEKTRPVKTEKLFLEDELLISLKKELPHVKTSATYKHILSHQIILSKFVVVNNGAAPVKAKNFSYYSMKQIHDLPKPVLISRFLKDYDYLTVESSIRSRKQLRKRTI